MVNRDGCNHRFLRRNLDCVPVLHGEKKLVLPEDISRPQIKNLALLEATSLNIALPLNPLIKTNLATLQHINPVTFPTLLQEHLTL